MDSNTLLIDMKGTFRRIESKLDKAVDIKKNFWNILMLPFGIFIFGFGIFLSYLGDFLRARFDGIILNVLISVVVIASTIIVFMALWKTIIGINNFQKIFNPHFTLLANINNNKLNSINEILQSAEMILLSLNNMWKLKFGMKLLFFIRGLSKDYNTLRKQEIQYFILKLNEMKHSLSIHINKQSNILIDTKEYIAEHISGTTALEQVSETQKLRLDEQIRQFEELQRVLVRL